MIEFTMKDAVATIEKMHENYAALRAERDAALARIAKLERERDEAITQRNRWHRLVQISQRLSRNLESAAAKALRERDDVKAMYDQLAETSDKLIPRYDAAQRDTDLLRIIDETRRLKEDEDPIAVSQQFLGSGPWIVHGRNGNRQPKIAYFETREQAEDCAHKVRRVIAEAVAPLKAEIEKLNRKMNLKKLVSAMGYAAVEAERDHARQGWREAAQWLKRLVGIESMPHWFKTEPWLFEEEDDAG